MTFVLWETVHADTQMEDLLETSVLFHAGDPGSGVVATFRQSSPASGCVDVRFARTPDLDLSGFLTYQELTPIAQVAAKFFPPHKVVTVAIPPVVWRRRTGGARGRIPLVATGAVGTLALLLAVNTVFAAAVAIPAAALVSMFLWMILRVAQPTKIQTPGSLELDGKNIVEYAQDRQLGHRPEMVQQADRRLRATRTVADIQTEFGELQADIVYRIDNSALFDSAVPTTERFQLSLIAWEDAGDVPPDELDSLAADVEISYSVARDNAETLGLFHLPETARSDGRRAAKAARLAIDSPNEGEREASRHQLIRILNSLALYWLPDVKEAAKAIESSGATTGQRDPGPAPVEPQLG